MRDQEKDFGVTLSAADAAAVDAMLGQDGNAGGESVDAARRARVEGWLKVVGSAPSPVAPADLAARALAAVQHAPIPFPTEPGKEVTVPAGRWRRRLAEFGAMAVAAALLLVVSLQLMAQSHRA